MTTTTRASTIRDVATLAGVAVSTVSVVFGGTRSPVKISHATSERVRRAAEAVGYHPNASARALRRRRTQNIGLLLSDNMPSLAPDTGSGLKINHIEAACAARGYTLQVMRYLPGGGEQALEAVAAHTVDGLIVTALEDAEVFALCDRARIPCVDVAGTLGQSPTCAVEADLVAARCEAMRYAARLGHVRIGV